MSKGNRSERNWRRWVGKERLAMYSVDENGKAKRMPPKSVQLVNDPASINMYPYIDPATGRRINSPEDL